jgi:N-acetylmuramoyl-L-alanine amidase
VALTILPKPVASSNYRAGRGGKKPIAIVIHISTSTAASCDAWFANPASKVSAHYLVCRDGTIHQYVDEENTAYHAGLVVHPTCIPELRKNTNQLTLGIEHEGKVTQEPTDTQYAASAALIAELSRRWDISLNVAHVIPHKAIRADKDCPGKVNVSRLLALAIAKSFENTMGPRPIT